MQPSFIRAASSTTQGADRDTAFIGRLQTTNASGSITLTRQYDPWGNLVTGASTPGYAYTGREWDAETGLYYYRARYYDLDSAGS